MPTGVRSPKITPVLSEADRHEAAAATLPRMASAGSQSTPLSVSALGHADRGTSGGLGMDFGTTPAPPPMEPAAGSALPSRPRAVVPVLSAGAMAAAQAMHTPVSVGGQTGGTPPSAGAISLPLERLGRSSSLASIGSGGPVRAGYQPQPQALQARGRTDTLNSGPELVRPVRLMSMASPTLAPAPAASAQSSLSADIWREIEEARRLSASLARVLPPQAPGRR
jgi:hypothetical protein